MSQARLVQAFRRLKTSNLKLPQNSQLKITSQTKVDVVLIPEWRDDGHVELEHIFQKRDTTSSSQPLADWSINTKDLQTNDLTCVDISVHQNLHGDLSAAERNDRYDGHEEEIFTSDEVHQKSAGITLSAKIPEKCNVICQLFNGGNILIRKKLEGEHGFDLMTKGGNIIVDKLRGDTIRLESQGENLTGGIIHVKKSCEAQALNVKIGRGGRLRAKMLNISDACIEVEDSKVDVESLDDDDLGALIDIGSIYASRAGEGAHLVVQNSMENDSSHGEESIRKIRVKSNHGHISTRTMTASSSIQSQHCLRENEQKVCQVELGGVNGSFDVSIEGIDEGEAPVDLDVSRPLVAKVHVDSLSPGQANILTSDVGDVELTLDRKIESDIRLLSSPLIFNTHPNLLLEDKEETILQSLESHDDEIEKLISEGHPQFQKHVEVGPGHPGRIQVETDAFMRNDKSYFKYCEYMQGVVENKSREPTSRFDVKTKGLTTSVGKIKTDGAAEQALKGFTGGNKYQSSDDISTKKLDELPLIVVCTQGRIKVESLSWIGAIARRYGIENEKKDVGRQAKSGSLSRKDKQ